MKQKFCKMAKESILSTKKLYKLHEVHKAIKDSEKTVVRQIS